MSALVTELTILRKPTGILSKRIARGEDGRPKPDHSGCRLAAGQAARVRLNGGDAVGGADTARDPPTARPSGRRRP
jgi:hypothetical protein